MVRKCRAYKISNSFVQFKATILKMKLSVIFTLLYPYSGYLFMHTYSLCIFCSYLCDVNPSQNDLVTIKEVKSAPYSGRSMISGDNM